jgi:hypothetical protein
VWRVRDHLAYKLKKPLVLPFLDYGTPQRTRELCSEEARLNRRLAAGVYLGVCAIVETPAGLALGEPDESGAIDYVVVMRRYDERDTMSAALDRGGLTDAQVVEVPALPSGTPNRPRRGGNPRRRIALLDEPLDAVRELGAVAGVPRDAKPTAGRISRAPRHGPGDITDVPEDLESDDPSLGADACRVSSGCEYRTKKE